MTKEGSWWGLDSLSCAFISTCISTLAVLLIFSTTNYSLMEFVPYEGNFSAMTGTNGYSPSSPPAESSSSTISSSSSPAPPRPGLNWSTYSTTVPPDQAFYMLPVEISSLNLSTRMFEDALNRSSPNFQYSRLIYHMNASLYDDQRVFLVMVFGGSVTLGTRGLCAAKDEPRFTRFVARPGIERLSDL